MAARDAAGTTDGLYVAAWGGHNGQSHNHNDVGNYLVYQNGQPALIDVGRPTYTRQTFSSDRYKIWAMQSAYHNLPTVNGQMQGVGTQYAATQVSYHADDAVAELQLDLAAAYPKSAGIRTWVRTIRLQREDHLLVKDQFTLREKSSDIVQHLMTPCNVELLEDGQLRLRDPKTGVDLLVALRTAAITRHRGDDPSGRRQTRRTVGPSNAPSSPSDQRGPCRKANGVS